MKKSLLGEVMGAVAETGRTRSTSYSKPEPPKRGRMTRLEIEASDNGGYTVTYYTEPKESSRNADSPIAYEKPVRNVFEDGEAALSYIGSVICCD